MNGDRDLYVGIPAFSVSCEARVRMRFDAPLVKQCPFADETDTGRVEIEWTTREHTLELHALAEWLRGLSSCRISHEDVTELIRGHLATYGAVADVAVVTRWATAGGEVVVRAVPGQHLLGPGA